MNLKDVLSKIYSVVMNVAGEQQNKMYTAESKMAGKTDEQLKNVMKSSDYSTIEKQAAMNEYKSRNNR